MENLTGKQFGPYRILTPLGEGGMATVYKAYQANMDRYVALKILPRHFASDPQFVSRFEQEAKVLAKLQHPHILPVHDFGEADGYTYIVMPFIESGPLTDLLSGKPLPLDQIQSIIDQVGDALDYAHTNGIVHRDVKPSNILMDERGNCLLMDFGIAKIIAGTANITHTGGIIGTPAYMSPEQGLGEKIDQRSDIYALGVILYEMTTGRVPYKAETPMATMIKHIHDPLPPPRSLHPDLPEAVEQVILKAMAKPPADRYTTAGEMVQALSTAIMDAAWRQTIEDEQTILSTSEETTKATNQQVGEATSVTPPQARSRRSYNWFVIGAVTVWAILASIIAGVFLFGSDGPLQVAATATSSPVLTFEATTATNLAAVTTSQPLPTPTWTREPTRVPSPTPAPATDTPIPTDTPTVTPSPSSSPTSTLEPTNTPVPTPAFANVAFTFGGEGIGPGLFTDARSVAVDNNTGNIYVGEYTGGRIQVFDETGKFITQWSVDPEMPLRGLAADRKGTVYAVQSGIISRYEGATGTLLGELEYDEGWGFDDVVAAADGGLVAAWYRNSDDIVRFDANGQPTLTISEAISEQSGSSELDTRVAIDGLGNIYALGTFNNAVFKFGPDGRFLDRFGGEGEGLGQLESPQAITVDGQGRVYVSELVGPVKIFDANGQYLASIKIQALGMTVNDQNELFVASRTRVVKFEVNGP